MQYRVVAALAAVLLMATLPARADDVAAFYRGKQVRIVVGSAVGGTYDAVARIVARHIAGHIPGHPTVIVQNLPTAGGLVMANQLFNQGPKDGTVLGAPINGLPSAPLLQPAAAKFDPAKLNWVGSTNREAYVAYVWHTVAVAGLGDVMQKELVVGGTMPGTTMVDFPLAVNDVLKTRFRIVRGYESTPAINHAMERGEIQGQGGIGWAAVKAQVPHWIAEKKIKVIAQYGLTRHPELPEVPTVLEFAKTETDRQALAVLFGRTEYGRPYFLPPDVPAERVAALRRAFDTTMKDPAFLADAAKIQLDVDPLTGEQVQDLIAALARTPPEIVARLRAALEAPVKP